VDRAVVQSAVGGLGAQAAQVVPGGEQLQQTAVLGVGDGGELAVEPLLEQQQEPIPWFEQPHVG
jgi:hypothetical protein